MQSVGELNPIFSSAVSASGGEGGLKYKKVKGKLTMILLRSFLKAGYTISTVNCTNAKTCFASGTEQGQAYVWSRTLSVYVGAVYETLPR